MLTMPMHIETLPPNPAKTTRHGSKARLTLVLYWKLLGANLEDIWKSECVYACASAETRQHDMQNSISAELSTAL